MNMAHVENTEGVIKGSRTALEYKTQSCSWGWRSFGALVGLLGGIVAALIGSVLTATYWITGVKGNGLYLQTLGTDFLLLRIPLLVLGAHCLDLVEKENRKQKEPESHGDKLSKQLSRSSSCRE